MKSQSKLQSDKQDKLKVLNDDINEINQQTSVLKSTIIEFRADAYKPVLSAEKKKKRTTLQDVKSAVTKANALKRAADEKQEQLYNALARKKLFLRKNNHSDDIELFASVLS